MENDKPVVNQEPVTEAPVSEDVKTQEPEAKTTEEVEPKAQAGDKTAPNLLLKSLQEEREKRRLLEEELETLKSSALSEEVFSDEGKALKRRIDALESTLTETKQENAKRELQLSNPIFKDKWEEFEEFRQNPENKGMNMKTAAKAYLIENGLFEPARKGLEKTTGGPRIPPTSGMTADDVKTLRETNFKKYQEMLLKGQIKIEQ
uniref:Scaffolding protein n=1 Tax=viral metagenome TaxID=1070528 RepID=A0A6M3LCT4_9ZZZZ